MASALILAAGRGERMRPLTDTVPKPLLQVGGRSLIERQVERLAAGGFRELVVNHAHLGHAIEAVLQDGSAHGVRIRYSHEPQALETAGGIVQALHLLGDEPFAVVSGDIFCAFDYATLHARAATMHAGDDACVAHFVLVPNPEWHAAGDMGLAAGRITRSGPKLTYGNIAMFHPAIFRDIEPGTWLKLFPWAYRYVDQGRVSGELYEGPWHNIGTPAQLADLDRSLR
jgi:N-acetyl-alpha-D-muramate 1-phosphate uridylyltransferase